MHVSYCDLENTQFNSSVLYSKHIAVNYTTSGSTNVSLSLYDMTNAIYNGAGGTLIGPASIQSFTALPTQNIATVFSINTASIAAPNAGPYTTTVLRPVAVRFNVSSGGGSFILLSILIGLSV